MTVTKSNYEVETKDSERKMKFKKVVAIAYRMCNSLLIPFAAAVILAIVGTFILKANNGACFMFNLFHYFCKSFFPCLPLMMIYIGKH